MVFCLLLFFYLILAGVYECSVFCVMTLMIYAIYFVILCSIKYQCPVEYIHEYGVGYFQQQYTRYALIQPGVINLNIL